MSNVRRLMNRRLLQVLLTLALLQLHPASLAAEEEQLTSKDMAECAAALVAMSSGSGNAAFDYSPGSLASVDEALTRLRASSTPAEAREAFLGWLGCYTGEVFVRNLNGLWYFPATEERAVLGVKPVVKLPGGLLVNPIGKAHKFMRNGIEDSVKALYEYTEKKMCAETPNPSIERTCPGKPGQASHVKR